MSIEIKKDLYLIECITNLHVGSGDSDFGLIDNRVQRDVLTEYPTINSSSLKGAFAVHFYKEELDENNKTVRNEVGKDIFGRGNDGKNDLEGQGKYKFFQANLLAIPVRSIDKPYYLVTSDQIIRDYNEMVNLFGGKIIDFQSVNKGEEVEIEGIKIAKKILEVPFISEEVLLLTHEKLKEITGNLPVVARNHLENGESKNLWYEEIVPRKSLFYFGIDKGVANPDLENKFNEKILFESNGKNLIHIGGNVTVGYGACKISKLGDK